MRSSMRFSRTTNQALLLGASALLVFLPAIFASIHLNQFVYDDRIHLLHNPWLRSLDGWKTLLSTPIFPGNLYRPVTFFTYWIEFRLLPFQIWHVLFFNAVLHAISTVLLFILLRKIAKKRLATAIALLFAIHPIHTEVIVNGVGRSEILALLFGLLGCLFAMRRKYLWAFLCLLLAPLSKESGLVFSFLLPVIAYYARKPSLRITGALTVLSCLTYLTIRFILLGSLLGEQAIDFVDNPLAALPLGARILNALSLLWHYLSLCIFPYPLSADYSYATVQPIMHLSAGPLLPIVGIGILLVLAILSLTKRSSLGFGIFWFFITLSLTSNLFFPIGTAFAERLAYTPSIGICMAIVSFLHAIRPTLRGWLYSCVALCFVIISTFYQFYWVNESELFERQVRLFPKSVKMLVNLSIVRRNNLQFQESEEMLEQAFTIYPRSADAAFALATLRIKKNDIPGAKKALFHALELQPAHVEAINVLARLLLREGEVKKASHLLEEGLKISPSHEKLLSALYVAYVAQQKLQKADYIAQQLEAFHSQDTDFIRTRQKLQKVLSRHE